MSNNHQWKLIEGYEDWKIYPVYQVFYIESIKSSAESAIYSWEQINNIVTDTELLKTEAIKLIDLAENIVNQSGIISRYFFPSRDNRNSEKNRIHQLRGEKLKSIYSIDEDNILTNRKFRNFIEHFDENLDQFFNRSVAGQVIPKTIFWNSSDIDSVTYLFKAYVIQDFKFISLSQEIELPKLVEEIYRIYNLSLDILEYRINT